MKARSSSLKRRRRRGDGTLVKIVVPVTLVLVVAFVGLLVVHFVPTPIAVAPSLPPACPPVPDEVIGTISVPAGPIDGYCQTELVNAAQIIRAADQYTSDPRAKEIGVMVAIGESHLQNLSYGDDVGPDSRGIFQQRSNWGTLAQRMDPYTAAYDFYQRMFGVVGWNTLPPTEVAHTVQGNADPNYYAQYFPQAKDLVAALLSHQVAAPPSAVPLTPSPTP